MVESIRSPVLYEYFRSVDFARVPVITPEDANGLRAIRYIEVCAPDSKSGESYDIIHFKRKGRFTVVNLLKLNQEGVIPVTTLDELDNLGLQRLAFNQQIPLAELIGARWVEIEMKTSNPQYRHKRIQ